MNQQDRETAQLAFSGSGIPPKPNEYQLLKALEASCPDTFAYDRFAAEYMIVKELPWGYGEVPRSLDESDVRLILVGVQKWGCGKAIFATVERAVLTACERNSYDSLEQAFRALFKWDGTDRIRETFITYFGAEACERTRRLAEVFFMQAAERALYPGSKADIVPVLQGREGQLKSGFFKAICPKIEWFGDDITHPLGSKESQQWMRGKFIAELSELHVLRKTAMEAVKRFISSVVDNYRPSYGRRTKAFVRRTIFGGTTNHSQPFEEVTRRLVVIRCENDCDTAAVVAVRDQLLAEAVVLMETRRAENKPLVTKDDEKLFREGSEDYVAPSGYDDKIATWKPGKKWFKLEDVFEFVLPGRDASDLDRIKKTFVAVMRRHGYETAHKTFKQKTAAVVHEKMVEGQMVPFKWRWMRMLLLSLKSKKEVRTAMKADEFGGKRHKEWIARWSKPPVATMRLWRASKYGMDGTVDHILDVYGMERRAADDLSGEVNVLEFRKRYPPF